MKKQLSRLCFTVALGILGVSVTLPAAAVRLSDGRVYFENLPRLTQVTTRDQFAGLQGRYHFTVEVPADAGEPLEALRISPRDHASSFAFDFNQSRATQGAAYARGPELSMVSIGGAPEDPNEVLMVFEEPVQPGETVTVVLKTIHNPPPGVYLFGVTAYPGGEDAVGQFLGYGRLHIYEAGN